jgi:hypothetical protein
VFHLSQTVLIISLTILGRFKVEKVFFNSNQTVQLISLGRFIQKKVFLNSNKTVQLTVHDDDSDGV